MKRLLSCFVVMVVALLLPGLVQAQGVTTADVLFVVDESGSMDTEHAWLGTVIGDLDAALVAAGATGNRYGLVGYGADVSGHGGQQRAHKHAVGGGDWGTAAQFRGATSALVTEGGTEDGWQAIDFALDNYTFRGNARVNVVLVTDEDRDTNGYSGSYSDIRAKLTSPKSRVLLNAVVNASFRDGGGQVALGRDSAGNAYVTDGRGGYTTSPGAVAVSGDGNTLKDYVDLAVATGGAAWDLNRLRAGGLTATSFTAAFVDIKVREIIGHDVAITEVNLSKHADICAGETIRVDARAANVGFFIESFEVRLYCDDEVIDTAQVSNLAPKGGVYLPFTWDTEGTTPGTHTIKVLATMVPGEINVANNGRETTVQVVDGHTLTISSTEGGSVTEPGEGDFAAPCNGSVSTKATAETCYKFTHWSGTAVAAGKVAEPNNPSTTVFVDADYTLIANFKLDPRLYLLDISSTKGGSVAKPGAGTFSYLCNTVVPLVAQPEICYEFKGWTGTAVDANKVEGPKDPKTTVIVDANYTLIANFAFENLPDISYTEGGYADVLSVEGHTQCQLLVTIGAIAKPCYKFARWSGSAVTEGKLKERAVPPVGFVADKKYTLRAHFEPTMIEDDFESYNDIDPNKPGSNRVFDVWVDGYGDDTNGALVGYLDSQNGTFNETRSAYIHGGRQSMPYSYDNDMKISRATKTVDCPCDWTEADVTTLSLWFRGAPKNSPEPMFVALNGDAEVYHDDPAATQIAVWTEWAIDLRAFADRGADLRNVHTITIGFGMKNAPAAGGQGKVYFDDIRLLRPAK